MRTVRVSGRWAAVASAMLVLAAGCHEPKQVKTVQAIAVFDQTALDFGEVPVGEWRETEVRIQNAGYVAFTAHEALMLTDEPSYEIEFGGLQRVLPGEDRV